MQKSKKNYKKIIVGIIAVIILVIVVVYYNTDSENLIELQPVEEIIGEVMAEVCISVTWLYECRKPATSSIMV